MPLAIVPQPMGQIQQSFSLAMDANAPGAHEAWFQLGMSNWDHPLLGLEFAFLGWYAIVAQIKGRCKNITAIEQAGATITFGAGLGTGGISTVYPQSIGSQVEPYQFHSTDWVEFDSTITGVALGPGLASKSGIYYFCNEGQIELYQVNALATLAPLYLGGL